MKTIIHIGQHKTGTTSIQNFLRDNRIELTQQGLYVPFSIAGYENPSHFILNVYALEKDRFSTMKKTILINKGNQYLDDLEIELKKEIARIYKEAIDKGCNQVIWSNEGLYLLNSVNEYRRLIALFSQHSTEIEVVCCFREVNSYRDSYIKQLSKQQIQLSKNPYSCLYLEKDSWLFDYKRKKDLLRQTFDKCTYFDYDPIDNIKKFMESIHFSTDKTDQYRLNVT